MTILRPFRRHAARQARLERLDVAAAGAFEADRAAELAGRREPVVAAGAHALLDRELDLVGQLVAVGAEQLDAVVLVGVVRGRDHHAEIGPQRARQHRDAGRRQRAEQGHVHAHRDEARGQRRLQHVAGEPRVLADHHAMAVIAAREVAARREAEPQRDLRGHRRLVGGAADAVGTEQLARHAQPSFRRPRARRDDSPIRQQRHQAISGPAPQRLRRAV